MRHDPFARGLLVGVHMAGGGVLTTRYLRSRLGVSKAQAKRYMTAVEAELPVAATVVEPFKRVELRLACKKAAA